MRVIRSFFVKTPMKLQELVRQICDHYAPMTSRQIFFYYDSTFIWETGSTSESYADVISRVLTENGWNPEHVFVGQPPRHDWKHQEIDLSLKGDPGYLTIRFNLLNNEFLKIAMEQTGVRHGRNGFEKDRSPESTPDSAEEPDEYKTHITDAFDTLWYGMNFYRKDTPADGSGLLFLGAK